jgi:hypothetical protein
MGYLHSPGGYLVINETNLKGQLLFARDLAPSFISEKLGITEGESLCLIETLKKMHCRRNALPIAMARIIK